MNRKDLRKQVTITEQGADKPLCGATTLLADAEAFAVAREELAKLCKKLGAADLIVSPDGLGLALGAAVATINRTGFVPAMTAENLPDDETALICEGGAGRTPLLLPRAAIKPGKKVVIIDDILASGRTTQAIAAAIGRQGGVVIGIATLAELTQRHGRAMLEGQGFEVRSVLRYGV